MIDAGDSTRRWYPDCPFALFCLRRQSLPVALLNSLIVLPVCNIPCFACCSVASCPLALLCLSYLCLSILLSDTEVFFVTAIIASCPLALSCLFWLCLSIEIETQVLFATAITAIALPVALTTSQSCVMHKHKSCLRHQLLPSCPHNLSCVCLSIWLPVSNFHF